MKAPISPPHREPNGRKQRPTTKADIEAAQKASEERGMAVVLSQPHRRGERSQLAESAWGRFCLRNKLARELFDAGEKYGGIYARWLMVIAGRATEGHVSGASAGVDPSPENIARIEADLLLVEAILKAASPSAYPVIRHMLVDCPTEDMVGMGQKERAAAIAGALALARHFYDKRISAY